MRRTCESLARMKLNHAFVVHQNWGGYRAKSWLLTYCRIVIFQGFAAPRTASARCPRQGFRDARGARFLVPQRRACAALTEIGWGAANAAKIARVTRGKSEPGTFRRRQAQRRQHVLVARLVR